MSDSDSDEDVTELLTELTQSLQELQTEIEPDGGPRLPTPKGLSQFASEVAIPGLILLLETNIRALRLLQRTIRLAEGKDPRSGASPSTEMRDKAETLSRATLSQIENTLSDVQSAVEGRPEDDQSKQILAEARSLRQQIQDELDERTADQPDEDDDTETQPDSNGDSTGMDSDPVDIDVEAELRSLKDNLEDDDDDEDSEDQSSASPDPDSDS